MKNVNDTKLEYLELELIRLQKRRIALRLNGVNSNPSDIVHAHMIAEKGTYMRDYIDSDGRIQQVDFIFVREGDTPGK